MCGWYSYISLRYSRLEPRLAHGINFDHLDSFILFDWVILLWCYLFSIVSMNMCTIYIYLYLHCISVSHLIFPILPPPKTTKTTTPRRVERAPTRTASGSIDFGSHVWRCLERSPFAFGIERAAWNKIKIIPPKRHKKQVLINHFCEWLLVCCFFLSHFSFKNLRTTWQVSGLDVSCILP